MPDNPLNLTNYFSAQYENVSSLLKNLISLRSIIAQEQGAQSFISEYLRGLGIPYMQSAMDEDIVNDSDYTLVPNYMGYDGKYNILVDLHGSSEGKSIIINSHTDVVPGPDDLFTPRQDGDLIFGRGACDAKGQVVTILLVLKALKDLDVRLKGDLQAQFVIEEESGGNGSLSCIRQGNSADAALILEPTCLDVCPANRGAVWYRIEVTGRSVHMGKYHEGVNAIDEMVDLIGILRRYEQKLRDESGSHPLFSDNPTPVVVNIGQINGGDWPATVADKCSIEGGIGFLPNKSLQQIQDEVRQAIESECSEWTRDHYSLEFNRLHNDAFEIPVDHPAVEALCSAADSLRGARAPVGMIASCDARLFARRGQMPTMVFGPGDLAHAHSLVEQIKVTDILKATEIITRFVMTWCGHEEVSDAS